MSDDQSCGSSAQLIVANPVLSHPQFDGGPTATAPLHYNSPAIDAGLNCAVTVDQRYVPRDQACDIGAYEFNRFNVVTITIDPKADINPYESAAMLTGTVSCTYADATPRTLRVELLQEQKGGKNSTWLQATQNIFFYCTTTPSPWNSALTPNGTTFVGGSALAKVQTTGTPTWYKPAATSSPVKLTVLRR